jgi:hypothetical protein
VKVLIFQLDGKIPNIALMRVAAHHRKLGNQIEFRWTGNPRKELWDDPGQVYGSAIFEKTRPEGLVESRSKEFMGAVNV